VGATSTTAAVAAVAGDASTKRGGAAPAAVRWRVHVAPAVVVSSVAAAEAEAAVLVATRVAVAGITPNNPTRTSMF